MDGKKTILIGLCGNLYTDQRMQRISAALQEFDWSVEVYYRNYFKYKSSVAGSDQYAFKSVGIKTPFHGGIAFYLYFNLILFCKLLFKKTDALYAVDSDTLPAFTLLSILKRKPLVYDAHEYFAEVPELQNSAVKKKIWHFITAMGVKRSVVRFTVAHALAGELSRVYKKPFGCIRNVPVLKYQEKNQEPVKPIIIYQGALNKGRMLELLINSMRSLPEFHCILAGEGDLSYSLRQMAEGMENIEFRGLMSPEQLKEITPGCFAGFNLLDAGSSLSYYYSLSNKYFDYMHARLPSISSELPEYMELNSKWKCGVCIENTETAFIGIVKEWHSKPETYAKLKENAKFAAMQNTWDNEKLQLKSMLQL